MIEKLDQEKFIVINRKRFDELLASDPTDDSWAAKKKIRSLKVAIENFVYHYELTTGKKMDQKYIVCNQDEPYAEEVAEIILKHV